MSKILILFVLSLQCVFSRVIQREPDNKVPGCEVAITGGLGDPQPLYLVPGTERFVLPDDSSGILRLDSGQTVELVCVGSRFNVTQMPWWWWITGAESVDSVMVTCIEGANFDMPWGKSNISTARCVSHPRHEATRTDLPCGRGALIEIGFRLSPIRFLSLFDVCHDSDAAATLYSQHSMTPANAGYQHSVPRPDFIQAGFYDFAVNDAYKRKTQKQTIATILNSTKLADKLVHDTNDYFMARGHLAAKADFIFGAHQRGSFYFLNTAPQWQTFNGGNWERVESAVRNFVAARGIEVDLFTGTHGVLAFADESGQHRDIYLNFDENANPRLPVPRVYYRIVYEPKTGLGLAVVGVNNPHADVQEIEKGYVYCTDIIEKVDWLDFNAKDLKKGYTYACELTEFVKAVPDAPVLDVKGILY